MWPAIPLVVEERVTGLAFGIAMSVLNTGCTILPLVVAQIYLDSNSHYIPNVEILFLILGIIGVLVGIYLNYYDYYYMNSVLNKPYVSEALLQDTKQHQSDDNLLISTEYLQEALVQPVRNTDVQARYSVEDAGTWLFAKLRLFFLCYVEISKKRQESNENVRRRQTSRDIRRSRNSCNGSFSVLEEIIKGGGKINQ